MNSKTYGFILIALLVVISIFSASTAAVQTERKRDLIQKSETVVELPGEAKRFALVIGVDMYQDPQISRLEGAVNDAKAIADTLIHYAGFPKDQVILLTTDQSFESGRKPTRGNILRRLSNLGDAVPQDGLLFVSFAGHGIEREGKAYLLPSDAQVSGDLNLLKNTSISVETIREAILQSGVGQVMVILDACRNDLEAGRGNKENPLTEAYTQGFNFYEANKEVKAFVTLYATEEGKVAYENKEKKQGYFTLALVEGLTGEAANDKGEITLSEIVKYLQEKVPKRVVIDLGKARIQRPFVQSEGYKADALVISKVKAASASVAPSIKRLQITNFPEDIEPPALGWGAFYTSGKGYAEESIVSDRDRNRATVMRIKYEVPRQGDYSGFWLKFKTDRFLPTEWPTITFWLRGDAKGGFTSRLKVELKIREWGWKTLYIENVTDQWKRFSLRLDDFQMLRKWNDAEAEFALTFENARATERNGIVYIDDIAFEGL